MRSVVQLYPGPPLYRGAVAQLGERLVCNQEATGSIPVSSTRNQVREASYGANFVVDRLHRSRLVDFLQAIRKTASVQDRAQAKVNSKLMLGVNATTDSVLRFMKVAWRRTLGWKEASSC